MLRRKPHPRSHGGAGLGVHGMAGIRVGEYLSVRGVLGPAPTFYYVHSSEFRPEDPDAVTGVTDYGRPVTACVGAGNVFGVQFHPEKSGPDGLALLSAFATC